MYDNNPLVAVLNARYNTGFWHGFVGGVLITSTVCGLPSSA